MKALLKTICTPYAVLYRPRDYFSGTESDDLLRNTLRGVGALLVLGTLLVFGAMVVGAAGFENDEAALEVLEKQFGVAPADIPYEYKNGVPYFTLLFGIYWLVVIALIGAARFVLIRIMGEASRSFRDALVITAHSVVPMVIVAVAIGVLNNVAPIHLAPVGTPEANLAFLRVGLVILFVFGGLIYEITIATKGLQVLYHQNIGRAMLTAVLPWTATCVLGTFGVFVGG
ncbi:MAG: YIP1 family protein [Leptospirales bacterium]|jgi:hypothetical protein